jgi:hypothetical protein
MRHSEASGVTTQWKDEDDETVGLSASSTQPAPTTNFELYRTRGIIAVALRSVRLPGCSRPVANC